nr:unnamed protein product [Digitaria exilis]
MVTASSLTRAFLIPKNSSTAFAALPEFAQPPITVVHATAHLVAKEPQRSIEFATPHIRGEHAVPSGHRLAQHFVEHLPGVPELAGRSVHVHEAGHHMPVLAGRGEHPARERARVECAAVGERPGARGGERREEGGEGEPVWAKPVAAHEAGEEREQRRRRGARPGGGAEEEVGEGRGRGAVRRGGEEEGLGAGEGEELGEEEALVGEAVEEELRVELVEAAAGGGRGGGGGARAAAEMLRDEVEALLERARVRDVRGKVGWEEGDGSAARGIAWHVSPAAGAPGCFWPGG